MSDDADEPQFYSIYQMRKAMNATPLVLVSAGRFQDHVQVILGTGQITWISIDEWFSWERKGLALVDLIRAKLS